MQTMTMQARMQNPAVIIPDAMPAILNVLKAAKKGGVPVTTRSSSPR